MMPINSSLILITNSLKLPKIFEIKQDQTIYLVDFATKSKTIETTFKIATKIKCNVVLFVVAEKGVHTYKINFNHQSKSLSNFKAKLFAINKTSIILDAKILINKNIKNVVADQNIDGFIFVDNASIKIIPTMIIDSNAIKANHAVKIAYFDKDKIFYLESKGLDRPQAIKLLVQNDISFLNNFSKNTRHKYIFSTLKRKLENSYKGINYE